MSNKKKFSFRRVESRKIWRWISHYSISILHLEYLKCIKYTWWVGLLPDPHGKLIALPKPPIAGGLRGGGLINCPLGLNLRPRASHHLVIPVECTVQWRQDSLWLCRFLWSMHYSINSLYCTRPWRHAGFDIGRHGSVKPLLPAPSLVSTYTSGLASHLWMWPIQFLNPTEVPNSGLQHDSGSDQISGLRPNLIWTIWSIWQLHNVKIQTSRRSDKKSQKIVQGIT